MTSGVGGVETFMTDLNSMIDHTTMETCFLVHQNINERYLSEINKAGSKIFCVTGIKNNPFKFFRDMFKLFRENDFDVVHLNECGASFFIYAFPVIFNKKIKFIVHSHNGSSRSVFTNGNYTDLYRFYQDIKAFQLYGFNADKSYFYTGYNNVPVVKLLIYLISLIGINGLLPLFTSAIVYGTTGKILSTMINKKIHYKSSGIVLLFYFRNTNKL